MKVKSALCKSMGLLAFTALGSASVLGQDKEKEAKPDRLVRLLPVGESPPHVEDIVDGKRVEREAPKGSIPPRAVVQVGKEGGERGDSIRLTLGQFSAPMPVGPGTLNLHAKGPGGADPKAWHTLKIPNKTHSLALLWRDPNGKGWDSVRSMLLADDLSSFPAGRVRFVNVSPWTLGLAHQGKKVKLSPYKTVMVSQVGAAALQVHLQAKGGGWAKIYDAPLNQNAGERSTVVIYKADGTRPRQPAKVRVMREIAKLPKPPRD